MFNLFSLFQSRPSPQERNSTVPPDLAIMLVRNFSKRIEDFNDDDLEGEVERFTEELAEIAKVQEEMTYEQAVSMLRRLDGSAQDL